MDCEHRAEDYFAGVLQGEERSAFERHLAWCEPCRDALEKLRTLHPRLSSQLPRSRLHPRSEWMARVKATLTAQPPRWIGLCMVLAAAAMVLALIVVAILAAIGARG